MKSIVLETVLGEYACKDGDIWDAHLHFWGRPHPLVRDETDLVLEHEALVKRELDLFYQAGGRVSVDFGPLDYHRNPEVLVRLSAETGVMLLMSAGFYRSPGVDLFIERHGAQRLKRRLVEEALYGEEKTGARPALYKWSTSDEITPGEWAALDIVAFAHQQTGLPVATHCNRGRLAHEQIAAMTERGIAPENIIIGHLDMIPDVNADTLSRVLDQGVYLSFDQLGKPKYGADSAKIQLIRQLMDRGFGERILCATDIGRRSCLKFFGGAPGYEHIPKVFRQELIQAGFTNSEVRQLLQINPAQCYRKRL